MQIFAGEDTYAAYHAAKQAAKKLAIKNTRELITLEATDANPGQLAGYLSGMSLFDSGKCVLLKRPGDKTEVMEYVSQISDQNAAENLVLWFDTKPDMRQKLMKQAKTSGYLYDFPQLKENKLALWVVEKAKELGLKWQDAMTSLLIEFTGGDKWRMENELLKIQTCAAALARDIDVDDLRKLIGVEESGDMWKFLDSLGTQNKKEAVRELEKLLRYEDSSQYVIAMLIREIGLLARVKSSPDGKELKLHPFVLEKTRRKASRYSWDKIKQLSLSLLRLDYTIKSGRIDPGLGLALYLLVW